MKQNNKTNLTVIALALVVVAGAGGFYAGMKYQQNKRGTFFTQTGNGQDRTGGIMRGGNGTRNGPASPSLGGFRPVTGEIIKSDDTSITVKLADGSSKIVLVTEKTDGSVTAQNVQINPQRMGINAPTPTATQ